MSNHPRGSWSNPRECRVMAGPAQVPEVLTQTEAYCFCGRLLSAMRVAKLNEQMERPRSDIFSLSGFF
jgi:hypothetical protein